MIKDKKYFEKKKREKKLISGKQVASKSKIKRVET